MTNLITVFLCVRWPYLFMFTAHRANRSVDILAFIKQAASTTWQAAWLRNIPQYTNRREI